MPLNVRPVVLDTNLLLNTLTEKKIYTYSDMAKFVRVSRPTFNRIIKGKPIQTTTALKIADALKLNFSALIKEEF